MRKKLLLIFKGQVRRYCQAFSKGVVHHFGGGKSYVLERESYFFYQIIKQKKAVPDNKKISQAIIVWRSRKKLLHYFGGRIVIIICWIMHVYHVRREGQTTYKLQFCAQSIQNVRECESSISCEIRHNYTIFFYFGVQCRRINATPYDQQGHNVDAKLLKLSSPLVHFGIHMMRPRNYLRTHMTFLFIWDADFLC